MSATRELEGKVAIVTGASSGIGAAVTSALLAAGANVVAVARRVDRLDALAAQARDRCLPLQADVTTPADAERVIERALAWKGRLDLLVNNAGVSRGSVNEGSSFDDFKLTLDTNVLAVANLCRIATPALRESKGTIVNLSSTAVKAALPGGAIYSASKAAVATFSESLRKELAAHDVRVLTVFPGLVDTEFFDRFDAAKREQFAKMRAVTGILQPEDVARVLVFAASQPAHVALHEIVVRPTRQIP